MKATIKSNETEENVYVGNTENDMKLLYAASHLNLECVSKCAMGKNEFHGTFRF